jgi:Domain of unknown function (DU1801)
MAEMKTKKTEASVEDFLGSIKEQETKSDCLEIIKIMKQVTKAGPKLWGSNIVGFGSTHLKYPSGRELDWMLIGFSPRKQNLTFYLGLGAGGYESLLNKLGKHTTGKGCLYIKKLADVDKKVLQDLITESFKKAHRSG